MELILDYDDLLDDGLTTAERMILKDDELKNYISYYNI